MGIDNSIISSTQAQSLFPLLNPKSFLAALYSPGDGDIDPTQLCNALIKLSIETGNAQIIEDCPVREILVEQTELGLNKIVALKTDHGEIKTDTIVNATGVWGNSLTESLGCTLPLIPMKHAYIVTEPMEGDYDVEFSLILCLFLLTSFVYFKVFNECQIFAITMHQFIFVYAAPALKWEVMNVIPFFWMLSRPISISVCTIWIGRHLIST